MPDTRLTLKEAAAALGVSESSVSKGVEREPFARSWARTASAASTWIPGRMR